MAEQTPTPQGLPGYSSSRPLARHWSGMKQAPWRVRLGCSHDYAEPGQPYRLLTDPEQGQALVCEGCYQRATA